MDVATFRTNFPAFQNAATYPDAGVQFWLDITANLVNADRWGALTDLGVSLLTAHNLVLEQLATKAAGVGGAPGLGQGLVTSKSVDKVSLSYDVSTAVLEGGGDLNLTTYGSRFYRLALMMGAGGLQVC